MADPRQPDSSPRAEPAAKAGKVTLLLCTTDAALRRAWSKADVPAGFRLATAPALAPEHLAEGDLQLILVDASAALAAEGRLAEALRAAAARCVWTGAADQIDRLGPALIAEAYDVFVTPTSAAVLGQRLAGWARNIRRAAALEEIGRRAETLSEQNDRLASRIAEVETQTQALANQHERLDQVLRRIRQVARLSREINALDLDRIVHVCIADLPALLEAERASLYLYDAAGDHLTLQGQTPGPDLAKRVDLKENPRSPMAVAVRSGELLLIGEFQEFERQKNLFLQREFLNQYATRSCVIVPLKGGGRVRGILNLADKRGGRRFDEDIDLPVVEQIAELIGASINNIELYQEMERRAKTDPLTGLANRRTVEEALAREIDRSRRHGAPLTVLMMDVDHLKKINDQHGHDAGDDVLRHLAATIAKTVRSVDVPGRWTGGDEFVIVLPDTSEVQARRLAERLVERVGLSPVVRDGKSVSASLSVGVAEYKKDEPVESLIRRVDQALYAAKNAGRGRIAGPDESPSAPD